MLSFTSPDGTPPQADVRTLVIAGWAGRDRAAVQHHIDELAAVGVAPPSSVPLYYRASAASLTIDPTIQVIGGDGSGEAEAVLFQLGGRKWIGIGSDHTDRKVESYSVAVSKQMCAKPVGAELWALDRVAGHWDELVLRSYATIDGERVLYQEGGVRGLLPLETLVAGWEASFAPFAEGTAMFCGTVPAIGGIRPSSRFEIILDDPVLKRSLRHTYDLDVLPVIA